MPTFRYMIEVTLDGALEAENEERAREIVNSVLNVKMGVAEITPVTEDVVEAIVEEEATDVPEKSDA